jgi:hypothetical protein
VRVMSKSWLNLLTVRSRIVKRRTAAIVLMTLLEATVAVGVGPASVEHPRPVTLLRQSKVPGKDQSKPAVKPTQQAASAGATNDGEYQPTSWYAKSGTRSGSNEQKYLGLNRWQQTDASSHTLKWESDKANTTNGFWVFQYKLSKETREAFLDFSGGRIDFGKKDGVGGGLVLAVYEGTPPAGLFVGQQTNVGKPALRRAWEKLANAPNRVIEPRSDTIRFSSALKEFSIVFIGVDPWTDSGVTIQIKGLRVRSRPAPVNRSTKTK